MSRYREGVLQPVRGALRRTMLVAPLAVLVAGCAHCGDGACQLGMPAAQTVPAPGHRGPGGGPGRHSTLTPTDRQRGYLDALGAAGVHPSSDLQALRIGSYVCQARAAGQSDQAVWELVVPLVRRDQHQPNARPPMATAATRAGAHAREATAAYIRTATDRLC